MSHVDCWASSVPRSCIAEIFRIEARHGLFIAAAPPPPTPTAPQCRPVRRRIPLLVASSSAMTTDPAQADSDSTGSGAMSTNSAGRNTSRAERIAAAASGERRDLSRHDSSWAGLYRVGGISGLVFVALVLVPTALVFAAPVPPVEGRALLGYIAAHKVVYLIELVCYVGLSVPALLAFAAVAVALRPSNKSIALIGGLLGVASETIALALGSSPQSLHGGLVLLSDSYQQAQTDVDRLGLVSAANALIAGTNAVTWAGILTAAAILVLSTLMRSSDGFGRALGRLGMITGVLGLISEVSRSFIGPGYLVYGLLLPTWFGVVGWKLLHLRRGIEPGVGIQPSARMQP